MYGTARAFLAVLAAFCVLTIARSHACIVRARSTRALSPVGFGFGVEEVVAFGGIDGEGGKVC